LVPTPAIDALAQDEHWFTDAHSATALCSPTVYCAMSGNMNYRSYAPWGVGGSYRESPFKTGEATLGSVAKEAGLATGLIDKWHLGGDFLNSKTGQVVRENGWKLILQIDHQVSKFEPIALFNLNDNPTEREEENKIHDPENAERVKRMRDRYIRIRIRGQRTTPD
jgi:arylsulfatase A-like enzyme